METNNNLPPKITLSENNKRLPDLTLTEIQKSKESITETKNGVSKIESITPWNNYTIVTYENDDKIVILDENCEKIDTADKDFSKKVEFIWNSSKMREKLKIKNSEAYISKDTFGSGTHISDVPIELRMEAKRLLGTSEYLIFSSISNSTYSAISPFISGEYIIFPVPQAKTCMAFKTTNDEGITLAPKDWKRFDPDKNYPKNLEVIVKKIISSPEGYKQLSGEYSVIITDVGINFVKNDDEENKPLFTDTIPSVKNNISVDPTNPNIIYYCQNNNPREINQIDISGDSNTWKVVKALIPEKYDSISNLQLDPSGNFFSFYSNKDFIVITRDSLEEVKRVSGLTQVNFDDNGRIRAVDEKGFLVIYEPDFGELVEEIKKQKASDLSQNISIADIFQESAKKQQNVGEDLKYLETAKIEYEKQFTEVLNGVNTSEGILELRQNFDKLEAILKQKGLKASEVDYIISGLDGLILVKEKEFAVKDTQETITTLREKLDSGLSMSSISESRALINSARASESLLDENIRHQFHEIAQEFDKKSVEFFKQKGGEVIKDIDGTLARIELDLQSFTSKAQMDDWIEFKYPKIKLMLGSLANDIPLEAEEAYKKIISARNQVQEMATRQEEKFKTEYAKIREIAVNRTETIVNTLAQDVDGLVQRLRDKGFTDRKTAEKYLSSSEARKTLEREINGLAGDDPDVAKELLKGLKVKISKTLTDIERGTKVSIAETGQQMIVFGETLFPKWEAKVKEKTERKVDLIFEEDTKTHGPGIGPGDVFGDLSLSIVGSTGKIEKVRLYQGWKDENEWRLGLLNYAGEAIPPSYISANKFREIKKDYSDWSQGDNSKLRKDFQRIREELHDFYSTRQKIGERTPEIDNRWREEAQQKIKNYATFTAEHHIPILRRIDQVKSQPEIEYTNGKGFVPDWQSHWVMDTQTEIDLEKMAKALKMQLDLQEGLVNLKGHAGTGKDVRTKMFCAMTNRPYFGIDCTKWTTEFELSEDVMLESKDGASQTVKVPSAVLNGITTPGAVVYFNEFNAMPEQAQIFLHALMDEKRSLTLKTSSGKTIHALPSVLLLGSMNPNYPGTFDIQFATRSRMVSIDIDYPPLTRKPDEGDTNPNPPYDSSEALRMARGIDSLEDLTYEADLKRNEFVKMWDHYVNGIDNGSVEPSVVQKFDIDTSLAIIQFSNKLRSDFVKIFEKSREAKNALPVSQPITGRELRRMAYSLSKMTPEQKAKSNPEVVARNLLNEFFLTHIDNKEEQDKIRTTMNTWTSKKRVMT